MYNGYIHKKVKSKTRQIYKIYVNCKLIFKEKIRNKRGKERAHFFLKIHVRVESFCSRNRSRNRNLEDFGGISTKSVISARECRICVCNNAQSTRKKYP